MNVTIDDLPDEMVVQIMTYLGLPDRKNTRLVNKRFYQLSYSAKIVKDDITTVNNCEDLKLLNLNLRYRNVKIKNGSEKPFISGKSFWEKCGSYVISLEIYKVPGLSTVIEKLSVCSENLEYLLLSACDENETAGRAGMTLPYIEPLSAVPKFPKLLSIDLLHMGNLVNTDLLSLLNNAPLTKRLSIEWLHNLQRSEQIDAVFKGIEDWTLRQGNILKELNLSRSSINDQSLGAIINNLGSQMTGLYLRHCYNLTEASLPAVAKLKSLKEIDLSMNKMSHSQYNNAFESLKKLTHISLCKSWPCMETFMSIAELRELIALELSDMSLRANDLMLAFGSKPFLKLIDLRLDRVIGVNDQFIKQMAGNMPNVKFLYLNCCRALTDRSLETLAVECKRLRSLSLQNCRKLTDVSILNGLPGLIHLDIYGCYKIHDDGISKLSLLELQTIDLSRTRVLANTIKTLGLNCPSLQDVYMGFDDGEDIEKIISDDNLKFKTHFGFSHFTAESIFDN